MIVPVDWGGGGLDTRGGRGGGEWGDGSGGRGRGDWGEQGGWTEKRGDWGRERRDWEDDQWAGRQKDDWQGEDWLGWGDRGERRECEEGSDERRREIGRRIDGLEGEG